MNKQGVEANMNNSVYSIEMHGTKPPGLSRTRSITGSCVSFHDIVYTVEYSASGRPCGAKIKKDILHEVR